MKHREPCIPGMFDTVTRPDQWPSQQGLAAGAEARDQGHKTAVANADDVFTDEVWKALRLACEQQLAVTSDDIWTRLDGRVVADKVPKQAMVIGAVMRTAATKGWIRSTGRVTKTLRTAGHGRHIMVWNSLIKGAK